LQQIRPPLGGNYKKNVQVVICATCGVGHDGSCNFLHKKQTFFVGHAKQIKSVTRKLISVPKFDIFT
jgi:hypothetical protein